MRTLKPIAFVLVGLVTLAFTAARAEAQMGQMAGMKGMSDQSAATASNDQTTRSVDQMMKNIDQMMADSSSTMRNMMSMQDGMQGGMHGGGQDPMTTTLQGVFDSMRLLQGHMEDMMKEPSVMDNPVSMKAFQQACRNLEQMASSYQAMTKHMSAIMMATMMAPKK